ncbi:hypothetical protein BaRGS_00012672 [Batillaria attramentaria]|uniref:Uncharacterized protein n=1 Tax=Batillaria attramentaria TaxID=370345 RepID=A0ABD0L8T8_9CAEN
MKTTVWGDMASCVCRLQSGRQFHTADCLHSALPLLLSALGSTATTVCTRLYRLNTLTKENKQSGFLTPIPMFVKNRKGETRLKVDVDSRGTGRGKCWRSVYATCLQFNSFMFLNLEFGVSESPD